MKINELLYFVHYLLNIPKMSSQFTFQFFARLPFFLLTFSSMMSSYSQQTA